MAKAKKKTKTTYRSLEEKKQIEIRLKTIEGQVRGLVAMVEQERYCGEILIQMAAIREALKSAGNKILKNHLATSIVDDMKADRLECIDEIIEIAKSNQK